jgi:arylsulfatase A-like enzyme
MKRPNILLIVTDQQRGDCLGSAGHPELWTPNLDGWADQGIRFSQGYTPCPICVAARRALITGRSPATEGNLSNADLRIPDSTPLMPRLFQQAGYQTFSIGRNMHQYPVHKRYGFEVRSHNPFEEYYSTAHQELRGGQATGAHQPGLVDPPKSVHYPHMLEHGISTNGYGHRTWPYPETYHETVFATNKAIESLDRRDHDDPFFMYLGFTAPHPPLLPPACYFDRYRRRHLTPPVRGNWNGRIIPPPRPGVGKGFMKEDPEYIQETLAAYYGLINHIDDQLARLMFRLQKENEPTLVLFTSDHGEQLGDHGLWSKCRPFQGSVHIPFLMFSVGTQDLNVGKQSAVPVSLIDILPTLLELSDLAIPTSLEGRSLVPLFSEPSGPHWGRPCIHTEQCAHCEHGGFHAAMDGRHKYIWYSRGGEELLFDLEKDPRETTDQLENPEYAAARQRLSTFLVQHLAGRPEGFSDGAKLIPGCKHGPLVPWPEIRELN